MAYNATFRDERRCRATRQDGKPCRAFARWGADDGLCSAHHFSHANLAQPGRVRGLLVTGESITPVTDNARLSWEAGDLRPAWLGGNMRRPMCKCSGLSYAHRPGVKGCLYSDKPSTLGGEHIEQGAVMEGGKQ